jgi:4-aminobutyrate aminotransferase-like enzyme
MATPYYFKRLRTIAKENEIPFIVDETKTGVGSTGKMWGHEHWFLNDYPDLVTFGGKAGISGYYTTIEFR